MTWLVALTLTLAIGAVSAGLLALAGRLVRRGVRGVLVDEHARCRACRFDLSGHVQRPARCPECSATLLGVDRVRIGRRRPHWPTVARGLACGALALTPAAAFVPTETAPPPAAPPAGAPAPAARNLTAPPPPPPRPSATVTIVVPTPADAAGIRDDADPASRPMPPLWMRPAVAMEFASACPTKSPHDAADAADAAIARGPVNRSLLHLLGALQQPQPDSLPIFDAPPRPRAWRAALAPARARAALVSDPFAAFTPPAAVPDLGAQLLHHSAVTDDAPRAGRSHVPPPPESTPSLSP